MKFTPQHIADFKKYLKVQKSAKYNMLDSRARTATGLDRDDYLFVIQNYEELSKLADSTLTQGRKA